jgi:N-sulfoglucosamine sulfohydrolase
MTSRREFLASAASVPLAAAAPARPPDILFCISDDQSWIHAGAHGSRFVQTPAFDRVAREGILFRNAFVSTPSCAPSRAAVLTGQDFYRLREAAMNHTEWAKGVECYPDQLAARGYRTGFTGKPWGPGNWKAAGRTANPCGPDFNRARLTSPGEGISPIDYAANFETFLASLGPSAPFCFWAGFIEPHRVFEEGRGVKQGVRLGDIDVPPFLPDTPEVRRDLADYADEIHWYDRHLGRMLQALKRAGRLENTIVVCTSDNGMAFPRAKGNLYEFGVHMPLALRWGARVKPGRVVDDFVSFTDFAPTFLEAAGAPPLAGATGRSLMPMLLSPASGRTRLGRDCAVFGIERHFPGSRPNGAGYPSRAIRTHTHLYIRNLTPDRNPVGDRPGPVWPIDDPTGGFGDTDGGLSKTFLWNNREKYPELTRLAFGKRPAEELYDIAADPGNLRNLAGKPATANIQRELASRLDEHLRRTADPRAHGRGGDLDAVMRRFPSLSNEVNRAQEGRTKK